MSHLPLKIDAFVQIGHNINASSRGLGSFFELRSGHFLNNVQTTD